MYELTDGNFFPWADLDHSPSASTALGLIKDQNVFQRWRALIFIVPRPRGAGGQSWPWTAGPASLARLEDAPLGLTSIKPWGRKWSSPSKRWRAYSVHLLKREAPQRGNQMGQSGPSPRFGRPEIMLWYEPNTGIETASPFGLGSWQFLSQEQPVLFKQPELESKGIKDEMLSVSIPALS